MTRVIYQMSNRGAWSKDFGLRDQIRRSAVSIMANIAEGFERGGDKEFQQFLSTAKASCAEVRSHLFVALDQRYVTQAQFEKLRNDAEQISRMLANFIRYLRGSDYRGSKYKTDESNARAVERNGEQKVNSRERRR